MADRTTPEGVVSAASDAEGVTIVRVVDAPRERVFAAWAQPASFAAWFGAPDPERPAAPAPTGVRAGDGWSVVVPAPWGATTSLGGTYEEVVEPELIVTTFDDSRSPGHSEVLRVTLRDLGDGRTEMTSSLRGTRSADEHARALAGALNAYDRLAEHVTEELKARHDSDELRGE